PPPAPPAPVVPPVPPVPHDAVAPAAPTGFRVAGAAFDIEATVCGMPFVRPLDPPGDQYHTVCWVRADFGVAPGSASGGTSYILGHSWAYAPLVLNQLSELATQEYPGAGPQSESGVPIYPVAGLNGYTITLTTPTGTLVYDITRSYLVAKSQAGNVQSLMANSPDRVVIITCAVKDGVDLDYNVIVEAQIHSSAAAVS
ncbi:MAG: putative secreted protein, partial [Pseudonocardiales bacterium]|nr:putative secreted protein [Pseudonocardiales bacterium]